MNFLRVINILLFFSWLVFSFFYLKENESSFFIKGELLSWGSFWQDSLQEEVDISLLTISTPQLSEWEGENISFSLKDQEGKDFLSIRSSFIKEDSLSGLILFKEKVSFSSLGIKVEGDSFLWNKNYSLLENIPAEGAFVTFEWPLGKGQSSFFSWDVGENKITLKGEVKGQVLNEKN